MKATRCLIVDDEPLALDVLEKYIGQLATLSLAGKCHSAIEALPFLQKNKVDLLFLDIQMPRLSGIDLIKTLPNRPAVILTTAFRDYALEGFDLNVLDYLLKPVSFERFVVAVNKYHALSGAIAPAALPSLVVTDNGDHFIYVKADKKMIKIWLKDILYIESLKDYVKIKTAHKEIITYQRITYLEEKLPDEKFLRIHRSFIVAIDHIHSFSNATIGIDNLELPIGRQYRATVMKVLGMS